jgi:hypothetical protein
MILKINSESLYFKDEAIELGVMMHAYNPSTQETEAGGLRAQDQSGQHSEMLSQKKILISRWYPIPITSEGLGNCWSVLFRRHTGNSNMQQLLRSVVPGD